MSYPEPRYDGQTGLVNATLRPADRDPDLTFTSGTKAHFLAGGALTDGKFGLYRWELAAASGGATPHFHRTIAESFYVLTGTPRLFDGARWTDGRPGDFLFVPEGGIHGFSNEADEPATMLILFAPGAPREEYFETLVQFGHGLEMTDEERSAFFLRHDNIWV
ncbi:MAG: cupin domain-containing protein [Chloroflexi bacterium]|nr:cupin domain-containing protein [Chloroflexota bacterium]